MEHSEGGKWVAQAGLAGGFLTMVAKPTRDSLNDISSIYETRTSLKEIPF
jgi:hypothetical protein